MHITNVPLILSSLTFALPYFAAIEMNNIPTAVCWGALTCMSTLVHVTKQPYHIHGPGNCIRWLYVLDCAALYACALRSVMDGYAAGPAGVGIAIIVLGYAAIVFYGGSHHNTFVYDRTRPDMAILIHASTHLLSAVGCTGVVYMRAFKTNVNLLEN
jgi:hypothetical protein